MCIFCALNAHIMIFVIFLATLIGHLWSLFMNFVFVFCFFNQCISCVMIGFSKWVQCSH